MIAWWVDQLLMNSNWMMVLLFGGLSYILEDPIVLYVSVIERPMYKHTQFVCMRVLRVFRTGWFYKAIYCLRILIHNSRECLVIFVVVNHPVRQSRSRVRRCAHVTWNDGTRVRQETLAISQLQRKVFYNDDLIKSLIEARVK